MSEKQYRVVVIHSETGNIEKVFKGPYSHRKAEKLDDGLQINLDHDRFHTVIEEIHAD